MGGAPPLLLSQLVCSTRGLGGSEGRRTQNKVQRRGGDREGGQAVNQGHSRTGRGPCSTEDYYSYQCPGDTRS